MFSPENSFGFLSIDKILNRDDEPHSILLIQIWIEYEPERGHHDSSNCQLEYDYNQLLRFQHNMFAAPAIIGTHTRAGDMNFTAKTVELLSFELNLSFERYDEIRIGEQLNHIGRATEWVLIDCAGMEVGGGTGCGGMKDNIPFWRMFQAVLYM